jgi:hypothetical protein
VNELRHFFAIFMAIPISSYALNFSMSETDCRLDLKPGVNYSVAEPEPHNFGEAGDAA